MRTLFSTLVAVTLSAVPSAAAVPSPSNSSLPACMALCPFGDMPFTVVVRDFANNPILGSTVVLDFSICPQAFLCPSGFGTPYPYVVDLTSRTLRAVTDAGGSITFPAHVGGTGPPGSVRVFADGVMLRTYALASPDQDGDGFVVSIIGADDPTFAAKLGTSDPTADFDCDGDVDFDDQSIFGFHHSQSCDAYVDAVRPSTWGALKLHYR
mgnify:FL=1